MGLTLGISLKLYTSLAKESKLKEINFSGLNPRFVEITGEKLIVDGFPPSPILNRVNNDHASLVKQKFEKNIKNSKIFRPLLYVSQMALMGR